MQLSPIYIYIYIYIYRFSCWRYSLVQALSQINILLFSPPPPPPHHHHHHQNIWSPQSSANGLCASSPHIVVFKKVDAVHALNCSNVCVNWTWQFNFSTSIKRACYWAQLGMVQPTSSLHPVSLGCMLMPFSHLHVTMQILLWLCVTVYLCRPICDTRYVHEGINSCINL